MYTFIDHDDDLSSKRIRDANARKAIRSHVMRDVRRRERLAGLKRITKRESRLKHPLPLSASISPQAESSTSKCLLEAGVASPLPASSSFVDSNPPRSLLRSPQERRRPLVWRAGYSVPPTPAPNPLAFPSSWLLDPFGSLMGAGEAPSRVARLVCYCECSGPLPSPHCGSNCRTKFLVFARQIAAVGMNFEMRFPGTWLTLLSRREVCLCSNDVSGGA